MFSSYSVSVKTQLILTVHKCFVNFAAKPNYLPLEISDLPTVYLFLGLGLINCTKHLRAQAPHSQKPG